MTFVLQSLRPGLVLRRPCLSPLLHHGQRFQDEGLRAESQTRQMTLTAGAMTTTTMRNLGTVQIVATRDDVDTYTLRLLCMQIYINMHTVMYIHILHVFIHTPIYVRCYIFKYTHMHLYRHSHLQAFAILYIYTFTYIYIRIYSFMLVVI